MWTLWHILRWTWVAVEMAYCLLAFAAGKRLCGREKTLNHVMLLVIAALVGVQYWIRYAFGGQVYRLALLVVGVAAAVAAMIVVNMLITQNPRDEHDPGGGEDESGGGEDRIQSLKLS